MKTFVTLALTLVLTAATLVGCGCTNQNMDNTSAPTVLPTNEEIWNSTESTTRQTTESTTTSETNNSTNGSDMTDTTDPSESSRSINETQVQNHVNDFSNMVQEQMKKNRSASTPTEGNSQNGASRMTPGTR